MSTIERTNSSHEDDFGLAGCFHGGAFFEAIGEELDHLERRNNIINADVLDAWFPPAPTVLNALQADLAWLLRTSPPTHAAGLIRAIAQARGVPADGVLPGPGSSALMFLALSRWLEPSSRVLLVDPSYGEYAHVTEQIIGCRVHRLGLSRGERFRLSLHEWLSCLQRDAYDLAVLVNPNNPTGSYTSAGDLIDALQRVPERTRVWIDEAYLEYAGDAMSLEPLAAESPNVVVCKSLSKVYALSGVRAAYLCGAPSLLDQLRRFMPPWSVSLPAQLAAIRALQATEYYQGCYRQTARLRCRLAEGLRDLGVFTEVLEGVANWVLCFLPVGEYDATAIAERCRGMGLFVRTARGTGDGLGAHALRIAVKDDDTQARMLAILQDACRL